MRPIANVDQPLQEGAGADSKQLFGDSISLFCLPREHPASGEC